MCSAIGLRSAWIYLNSEIIRDAPYAERFKGLCFRPLHYFFDGQTREWAGSYQRCFAANSVSSYPPDKKCWPVSLLNAVVLLPGLIVGTAATVAAIAEWCLRGQFSSLCTQLKREAEKQIYAKEDQANSFAPPVHPLPPGFSINHSHADLCRRWIDFRERIVSPNDWNRPEIRQEFNGIIEAAHKEMSLLFQHAAQIAENDPERMSRLLGAQHVWEDADGENYCKAYFYHSIGRMFHNARMAQFYRDGREVMEWTHWDSQLKWEKSSPFFTPGTLEYRWRRLYNDACLLIDRYPGLKEALNREDSRFVSNAVPYYSPSSQPSSWQSVPTL